MVDREAFVLQLVLDATVAVASFVLCMYGLDSLALVGIAVGLLLDVVVVCGAG